MTLDVLDRELANGSTLYRPSRRSPAILAAQNFYERGAEVGAHRIRITAFTERMKWLAPVVEGRINDLLALGAAWDGHRAEPITLDAALAAASVSFALCADVGLAPQIFPLPDGGLQLEWHAGGHSLEIEIDAEGEAHALAATPDGTEVINEAVDATSQSLTDARAVLRRIESRVTRTR
jgi:hypothetical protein